MKHQKSIRLRKGTSLMEVMFATSLTVIVLVAAVSTFLLGMLSWVRGQGKIDAESGTANGLRIITRELREAMTVTVDSNGQGLTYRLPSYDSNGNYVIPIVWDGVSRRIELQGSQMVIVAPGINRIVAKGLILTDPQAPVTLAYRPFTPGIGSITRSINVMLVSQRDSDGGRKAISRSRETIYLRNVPDMYN